MELESPLGSDHNTSTQERSLDTETSGGKSDDKIVYVYSLKVPPHKIFYKFQGLNIYSIYPNQSKLIRRTALYRECL